MGNELIAEELATQIATKRARTSLKQLVSSKVRKLVKPQQTKHNHHDSFFVNYLQKNRCNVEVMQDLACFDQRRQVFVSLLGLYRSWTKMPAHVLYSSLMILPLKRCWVFDIVKHRDEYKAYDFIQFSVIHQDAQQTRQFLDMLRWKDSQGLVFWMLDEYEANSNQAEPSYTRCVAPFWRHFSAKLANLYDPVRREKYKALRLDARWWLNLKQEYAAKYTTKSKDILKELVCLKKMKFAAIQEIIYQSNPDSLNPIISYDADSKQQECAQLEGNETAKVAMANHEDMNLGEGWWISNDYDPYDLAQN